MSAVVGLNPSGVSRCTSCNVYRALCRAMYAFTEAHASSMGLSSQWATGKRSTVCMFVCCFVCQVDWCWSVLFDFFQQCLLDVRVTVADVVLV